MPREPLATNHEPLTTKIIPYGRQLIDQQDIDSVIETLQSDWLTTGPKVKEFEEAIASYVGAKYAVAVCNGTAALHCAMFASGIGKGDEVIVTPMTFAASSNCILYVGAKPVFADVLADTLLIDPSEIEKKITSRTRAVIAVDYAGQPCDYDSIRKICDKHNLIYIADGCHALGADYKGKKVGSIADMTCFSFHPVKHITTGEGGAITTDNPEYYEKLRLFRSHGITTDLHQREKTGAWFYEMTELGYNYRITDFQCALGISQLKKLDIWIKRRNEIARKYIKSFDGTSIIPLTIYKERRNAYHLFVVKVPNRNEVFKELRKAGISANVHYIPVHLHPYYKKMIGTREGDCPVAEEVFNQILSLPMYPGLQHQQQDYVIQQLMDIVK